MMNETTEQMALRIAAEEDFQFEIVGKDAAIMFARRILAEQQKQEPLAFDFNGILFRASGLTKEQQSISTPLYAAPIVNETQDAQDAKRYRHMRASAEFQNRNGPGVYWYLPRWNRELPIGERLDAAIDEAMRGKEE